LAGGNGVGSKQELILIDTNIFVIDLRYKRDTSFKPNQSFLSVVAQNGSGFTTIVNLLELCGILSFNLNQDQFLIYGLIFKTDTKLQFYLSRIFKVIFQHKNQPVIWYFMQKNLISVMH
jgi:hypothetical protein